MLKSCLAATTAVAMSLVMTCVSFAEPDVVKNAPVAGLNAQPASFDQDHARNTFERLCTGCHDAGLVTGQGHDRAEWQDVVSRMYGFGLTGSDEDAQQVLEYLTVKFPAKTSGSEKK